VPAVAVSHSTFAPDSLAEHVAQMYPLQRPIRCALVSPGVNDTYRVLSGADSFYYRVYRAGLRSPSDIEYEIDLLRHLAGKGVPVSVAIPP